MWQIPILRLHEGRISRVVHHIWKKEGSVCSISAYLHQFVFLNVLPVTLYYLQLSVPFGILKCVDSNERTYQMDNVCFRMSRSLLMLRSC